MREADQEWVPEPWLPARTSARKKRQATARHYELGRMPTSPNRLAVMIVATLPVSLLVLMSVTLLMFPSTSSSKVLSAEPNVRRRVDVGIADGVVAPADAEVVIAELRTSMLAAVRART